MRKAAREAKKEDVWVREFVARVVALREERRDVVNRSVSVSDEEQHANMAEWGVVGFEESLVEDEETGEWGVVAECSAEWAALLG